MEYYFENFAGYEYLRNDITFPIFHIWGKKYSVTQDSLTYQYSDLKKILECLGKGQSLPPILMFCEIFIKYLLQEYEEEKRNYGCCNAEEEIEWFINAVAEDLLTSNINAALYKTPDGYEFFLLQSHYLMKS